MLSVDIKMVLTGRKAGSAGDRNHSSAVLKARVLEFLAYFYIFENLYFRHIAFFFVLPADYQQCFVPGWDQQDIVVL